jgi:hypothetical protein
MAVAVNTTYSGNGLAESFSDVIWDISPEETPILSMCKRISVTGTYHEYQTDVLAAAAANTAIEGNDASFATIAPTTVLGTRMQISTKTVQVSGTFDAVKKYGRKSETAYQLMRAGKALKRDMDYTVSRNQASSAGGSATARATGGLECWISGNRILATGNTTGTTVGFASGNVTAPTDGTQVTFIESDLTTALQAAWTDGGDPRVIVMSATNKNRFNAFAGIATKYNEVKGTSQAIVSGAADVYVSNFGNHTVKLSRQVRDEAVLCIDPDYISLGVLRPVQKTELAKTGDSAKHQILVEFGLIVNNPDAHAKLMSVGV